MQVFLINEKDELIDSENNLKTKFDEIKEVKNVLLETIMKEMRGIEKKNLQSIKKFAEKESDFVIIFILDSFTKFFTGKKTATYS